MNFKIEEIKCPRCGESHYEELNNVCKCKVCDSSFIKIKNSKETSEIVNLLNIANLHRKNGDYDLAIQMYEEILAKNSDELAAYEGLLLAKYGIEYVKDERTNKYFPVCHRMNFTPIYEDNEYKRYLKKCNEEEKVILEQRAKDISKLQEEVKKLKEKGKKYDVFISFKATDNERRPTIDSDIARDIYDELTKNKINVFFSEVELKNYIAKDYEAIIYNAIQTCKIFILVGSSKEYVESTWVRNEWKRFIERIEDATDVEISKDNFITVYKGMNPNDMPKVKGKNLQAVDAGKIGWVRVISDGLKGKFKLQGVDNIKQITNELKDEFSKLDQKNYKVKDLRLKCLELKNEFEKLDELDKEELSVSLVNTIGSYINFYNEAEKVDRAINSITEDTREKKLDKVQTQYNDLPKEAKALVRSHKILKIHKSILEFEEYVEKTLKKGNTSDINDDIIVDADIANEYEDLCDTYSVTDKDLFSEHFENNAKAKVLFDNEKRILGRIEKLEKKISLSSKKNIEYTEQNKKIINTFFECCDNLSDLFKTTYEKELDELINKFNNYNQEYKALEAKIIDYANKINSLKPGSDEILKIYKEFDDLTPDLKEGINKRSRQSIKGLAVRHKDDKYNKEDKKINITIIINIIFQLLFGIIILLPNVNIKLYNDISISTIIFIVNILLLLLNIYLIVKAKVFLFVKQEGINKTKLIIIALSIILGIIISIFLGRLVYEKLIIDNSWYGFITIFLLKQFNVSQDFIDANSRFAINIFESILIFIICGISLIIYLLVKKKETKFYGKLIDWRTIIIQCMIFIMIFCYQGYQGFKIIRLIDEKRNTEEIVCYYKRITDDGIYELNNPEKLFGYSFDGWSLVESSNGNSKNTLDVSKGNEFVLVANWVPNAAEIYLDVNGGNSLEITQYNFAYEEDYTLPIPSLENYSFDGWYSGSTKVPVTGTWKYTENITLVAKWVGNVSTVKLDVNGGVILKTIQYDFVYGDDYTLPIPTLENYSFDGWYNGSTKVPTTGIWNYGENITLVAKWVGNVSKVMLDVNGGNGLETTQYTFVYGERYTLPTPVSENYKFKGWYNNLEKVAVSGTWNYSENITLVAKWAAIVKIDLEVNGGNELEITQYTLVCGDSYNLPTPTLTNYNFDGWYNGSKKVAMSGTWDYSENITLVAKWKIITYVIIYHDDFNNTHESYSYDINTVANIMEGKSTDFYNFIGWYSWDGIKYEGNYTVTKHLELTAKYEQKYLDYTYISNASDFEQIRSNPSGKYMLTESISLGNFKPIENFSGVLDGKNFTISDWTCEQNSISNFAIFITNSGEIKNLVLSNCVITSSKMKNEHGTVIAGILCAWNTGNIHNIVANDCSLTIHVGHYENDNRNIAYVGTICGMNENTLTDISINSGYIYTYASTEYSTSEAGVGMLTGVSSGGAISNITCKDNKIEGKVSANYRKIIVCIDHGSLYGYVGEVIGLAINTNVFGYMQYSNNTINFTVERSCGCNTNIDKCIGGYIGKAADCSINIG